MNTIDIRIFAYDDKSWRSRISIWNITEEQLDKECCIYNWAIYWKEGIPEGVAVKNNPTLRDVWNLECYEGWQCTKYMRDQFESFKKKKD
jgi:hypothetical protein